MLLNDQEARTLTRTPMLLGAAREVASWGPRAVVIKLGEDGCALLQEDRCFPLPGYPLERIAGPTGAGTPSRAVSWATSTSRTAS